MLTTQDMTSVQEEHGPVSIRLHIIKLSKYVAYTFQGSNTVQLDLLQQTNIASLAECLAL